MNIKLVEVNRDNCEAVVELKLFDEQMGFVADNSYCLTQAKSGVEFVPMAIYNDDELVGFLMYKIPYESAWDIDKQDENEYWIFLIMIDKNHQKKGYGRAAMQLVLDIIKQDKKHNKVYIDVSSENTVAKTFYESMGFVPDGKIVDDEMVYVLHY
jgi:diamine N-acetyltransferase